jgi:glycosyltransferase involved in cell wall biosynthesis
MKKAFKAENKKSSLGHLILEPVRNAAHKFWGVCSMKKKILLLHEGNFPPVTGGEYVINTIYKILSERFFVKSVSISSAVWRLRRTYKLPYLLAKNYVDFRLLCSPKFYRKYALVFTSWNPYFPVLGDLAYYQPEAGMLNPISFTFREFTLPNFGYNILDVVTRLFKYLFSKVSKNYYSFIANSKFTAELLKEAYGVNSRVIYPPIPNLQELMKADIQNKENIVLCVGRVVRRKDFELIGEIASKLKTAEFVLIGPPSDETDEILRSIRKKLKENNVQNFVYLGWVSDEEKVRLMSRAKILLHPTRYEMFGLAIVEGMAAGCLPVVHNSGGPKEFVPSNCLFESAEEAIEKISEGLNSWSASTAEEMRSIASNFSNENFSKKIIKTVEMCLERKLSS